MYSSPQSNTSFKANVDNDTDVQAARRVRAEETAEMVKFDDTSPPSQQRFLSCHS